jgi:hypothetical protein
MHASGQRYHEMLGSPPLATELLKLAAGRSDFTFPSLMLAMIELARGSSRDASPARTRHARASRKSSAR